MVTESILGHCSVGAFLFDVVLYAVDNSGPGAPCKEARRGSSNASPSLSDVSSSSSTPGLRPAERQRLVCR